MRRTAALTFFLAAFSFARATHAAETLWVCVYMPAEAPAIGCMLATAGAAPDANAASGHLPAIVARIRQDPAAFDGETIVIPLHAPPIDPAFAERLARSVMCGRNPACRVQFAGRFEAPR